MRVVLALLSAAGYAVVASRLLDGLHARRRHADGKGLARCQASARCRPRSARIIIVVPDEMIPADTYSVTVVRLPPPPARQPALLG